MPATPAEPEVSTATATVTVTVTESVMASESVPALAPEMASASASASDSGPGLEPMRRSRGSLPKSRRIHSALSHRREAMRPGGTVCGRWLVVCSCVF